MHQPPRGIDTSWHRRPPTRPRPVIVRHPPAMETRTLQDRKGAYARKKAATSGGSSAPAVVGNRCPAPRADQDAQASGDPERVSRVVETQCRAIDTQRRRANSSSHQHRVVPYGSGCMCASCYSRPSSPRGKDTELLGADSTGSAPKTARTGTWVMVWCVRIGKMWGGRACAHHPSNRERRGTRKRTGNRKEKKEQGKTRQRTHTKVDWPTMPDALVNTLVLLSSALLGGGLEGGGVGALEPGSLALLDEPVSLVVLGLVGALALDDGLRMLDRPGRLIAVPCRTKRQDKVSKGRYRRSRRKDQRRGHSLLAAPGGADDMARQSNRAIVRAEIVHEGKIARNEARPRLDGRR
ncbi:hypothetical protein B0H17DRAFT_1291955 [Mycena rosella]|uniref:Uncharacterized protein n=1 Tax=Mycena rosella TaxID=1033263 RepID=A0AAD7DEM5_MYCRO|nr:hypothetical protein B0H17DRAFT_1291955 [Mycena rosella]